MEVQVIGQEKLMIDVKRKKDGMARGFGKVIGYTIGIIGIIFSGLLFATIIGIFPGITLFFGSLGIIYLSSGKQQVTCPSCKKRQPVVKGVENFKCSKCQNLTIVNWK
jgi:LSD1 subclass zinc finger protein